MGLKKKDLRVMLRNAEDRAAEAERKLEAIRAVTRGDAVFYKIDLDAGRKDGLIKAVDGGSVYMAYSAITGVTLCE